MFVTERTRHHDDHDITHKQCAAKSPDHVTDTGALVHRHDTTSRVASQMAGSHLGGRAGVAESQPTKTWLLLLALSCQGPGPSDPPGPAEGHDYRGGGMFLRVMLRSVSVAFFLCRIASTQVHESFRQRSAVTPAAFGLVVCSSSFRWLVSLGPSQFSIPSILVSFFPTRGCDGWRRVRRCL